MAYSVSLAKAGKPRVFNKVHLMVAEGNFVLVATDYTQANKPRAYYELYRINASKIAERWMVDEAIPPTEAWKNSWGKY